MRTQNLETPAQEIADLDKDRNVIRLYILGAKRVWRERAKLRDQFNKRVWRERAKLRDQFNKRVWRERAKLRDQKNIIDERVAQVEDNGAISYIHTDHQSSVIAITDSAGNPVSRRNYGVYGETNSAQMTGASAGQSHPFGYTGRRYDADTGLYYYRARWYDPELGTFLETDPLGELDYINMYAYVGVNPLNATDPSGMWNCSWGTSLSSCDEFEAELTQVRTNLRQLREQVNQSERATDAQKASANRLLDQAERAASNYGTRGDWNGVVVGNRDLPEYVGGGTGRNGFGQITVDFDFRFIHGGNQRKFGSMILHEGVHVGQNQRGLQTTGLAKAGDYVPLESEAYRVQYFYFWSIYPNERLRIFDHREYLSRKIREGAAATCDSQPNCDPNDFD